LLTTQRNIAISFDSIGNFKTVYQVPNLQNAESKYMPIPILNVRTAAIQTTASNRALLLELMMKKFSTSYGRSLLP